METQVNATVKAHYLGEFVDDALEGAGQPSPSTGPSEIANTIFLGEFVDYAVDSPQPPAPTPGDEALSEDQVRVLKELVSRWMSSTEVIAARPFRAELTRSGMTEFQAGLALAGLEVKGMIRSANGQGWDEKHARPAAYPGFVLTPKAILWLEANVAPAKPAAPPGVHPSEMSAITA